MFGKNGNPGLPHFRKRRKLGVFIERTIFLTLVASENQRCFPDDFFFIRGERLLFLCQIRFAPPRIKFFWGEALSGAGIYTAAAISAVGKNRFVRRKG